MRQRRSLALFSMDELQLVSFLGIEVSLRSIGLKGARSAQYLSAQVFYKALSASAGAQAGNSGG